MVNLPMAKTFNGHPNILTSCSTSTNLPPSPMTPRLLSHETSPLRARRFYLPSLLLSNIRSLAPKVDELEMVASLNEVSIICITETWLTPNIPDSAVLLPNFFLFRNDREFSTGGGVCTYVSCDITSKRLTEFEKPKIESLWLSLRPKRLPQSISIILVAVIYHTTSSGASENCDLYNHDELISSAVNYFFPIKKTKISKSDKQWMTPSLKVGIFKRQKAFCKYGKTSKAYKFWRNKVQHVNITRNQWKNLKKVIHLSGGEKLRF